MSDQKHDPRIISFINRLDRLDAGGKARLKRMAGQRIDQTHEVGYFYSLLPPNVPEYQEQAYFLLATIYPLAEAGKTGDLGSALRLARNDKNAKGLDRRVRRLLDADDIQLPFHIRQAVRFLKSSRKSIDWARLLEDLLLWNVPDHPVQRRWARSYFAE